MPAVMCLLKSDNVCMKQSMHILLAPIIFIVLLAFAILTPAAFCYEAPIPEQIYATSENEQYLLHIIPMFESPPEIKNFIERKALIVTIYKKNISRVMNEEITSWVEISQFRAQHPSPDVKGFAEVRTALISNDGNFIVVQSEENVMAIHDVKVLFIYDKSGHQIAGYSPRYFYNRAGNLSNAHVSIRIDNEKRQLLVQYTETDKKIFDLTTGKSIKNY